jgi:endo-1,4-beta-xylanase
LWLINGRFSPDELKSLMVAHIATEAGRYRGAVYAWDVVNEPFADDGGWRKSIWYDAMGPDYVAVALKAARAADPEAKLYINDYGVETARPKMRALHDLVASLKRDGVPIDGVGLQSHFVAGSAPADLPDVMEQFAALSVDVAVTELDLRIRLPTDVKSLAAQAGDYASVVRACRLTAALPFDAAYRPEPAVAPMTEAWKASATP